MEFNYRQSSISTFLRCGLQFYYRYIEGIITPPSGALTVGSATHKAIAANMVSKIQNKRALPLQDALDVFSSEYDSLALDTDWGDESRGHLKDVGAKCVELHYTKVAPLIEPAKVEENFELKTDQGYSITGTIDLVDTTDRIRDAKTASTQTQGKYNVETASRNIQPLVYDLAFESLRKRRAKGFVYDVLVKAAVPYYRSAEGRVTRQNRKFLFQTLDTIHKSVTAGIFLPAPDDAWWCSKKWCGYTNRCPKFKKGRK